MITFNTVEQLSQAYLKNDVTVRILNPISLMATTISNGPGIPLASGNVARIDFDLLETATGRQISHVIEDNIIEKAVKDVNGNWVSVSPTDANVSISMAYLNGNLWIPDTPNSTGSPYSITSWENPSDDILQITTLDNVGGVVVLVYSRFTGIIDRLNDIEARVTALEAFH